MAIQLIADRPAVAQIKPLSNVLADAERLKGLRQQNAMTDMEMADKQNLDRAYRESGGDINAMVSNPNLGFEAGTKLQSLSAENVKAQAAAKAALALLVVGGAATLGYVVTSYLTGSEGAAIRSLAFSNPFNGWSGSAYFFVLVHAFVPADALLGYFGAYWVTYGTLWATTAAMQTVLKAKGAA